MSRPRPRGEVVGSGWGGCLGPDPGGRLGGLGGVQAHNRGGGVQAYIQGGGCRPTPGVSRPRPRGVSQHALGQTPSSRRLLLRAVRILLECILVILMFVRKLSLYFPAFQILACQILSYAF